MMSERTGEWNILRYSRRKTESSANYVKKHERSNGNEVLLMILGMKAVIDAELETNTHYTFLLDLSHFLP